MLERRAIVLAGLLLASLWSVPLAAASTQPPVAVLRKQAASGDPAAEVALGKRLMQSHKRADKAAGVGWFRKAAMQGNAEGQWQLGWAYFMGLGVAHDMSSGLKWMRKSLPGGPPDHMAEYGMMEYSVDAMTGTRNDGAHWVRKAAHAGSTKGMTFLAIMHLLGHGGVRKDKAAAEKWLLKASRLGDPNAQSSLGQAYIAGMFGKTDVRDGLDWLRKAARQGDTGAEATLGYFLVTGKKGVPSDPAEGVRWARKAVAKRSARGHYVLGLAYQYGRGEPADPARAWYHFAMAERLDTKHRLTKASSHMSEVATRLSAGTLEKLQARVSAEPGPKSKHG